MLKKLEKLKLSLDKVKTFGALLTNHPKIKYTWI